MTEGRRNTMKVGTKIGAGLGVVAFLVFGIVPVSHPRVVDAMMNIVPDTITPITIEAATIILGSSPALTGIPKIIPAMLRPITPPRNEPGSRPNTAKSTTPHPAPMYASFFV